ncbi:MAG TPA: hypothetical protein VLA93_13020 [Pyrinomonadaceae bacterium]|nr:hypothetical protein [Pyrinomonadaceae bacterium]
MKNFVALTVCVGLFLTAILFMSVLRGSSQVKADENPRPEVDFTQFPIADLNAPESSDESTRLKRIKKSKKYNTKSRSEISDLSNEIFVVNEALSNLPALPVQQSSVVLLGRIASAAAYLSEDKSSVYSEFEVEIETVFKNTSKQALKSDKSVLVERFGGRVRLPSGKLFIAAVDNQDMPRVGSRYVLFLTNDFLGAKHSDEDFHILMGYELKEGKVVPLDRTSAKHPISRYLKTDETVFLRDLSSSLAKAPTVQN